MCRATQGLDADRIPMPILNPHGRGRKSRPWWNPWLERRWLFGELDREKIQTQILALQDLGAVGEPTLVAAGNP
jgi:hypothetical protein